MTRKSIRKMWVFQNIDQFNGKQDQKIYAQKLEESFLPGTEKVELKENKKNFYNISTSTILY
ncbi:MAG: hypothetical protein KTR26_08805 [Flammeovirgaceae bacterium]|nr:hypothetical protein [Flammeovirgaceae bacterium]